tara:strand:+ start:209 stop:655 length:447 start_codon:yes stop_codon:yes gene_type:complete
MICFSHRGNLRGKSGKENTIQSIIIAVNSGYHVEIDIWKIGDKIFLGHDEPDEMIDIDFLKNPLFLCHAKNAAALEEMIKHSDIHCFWHEEDKYTITSKGYIISYPGFSHLGEKTIIMKPESHSEDLGDCYGICSDYISYYSDSEEDY